MGKGGGAGRRTRNANSNRSPSSLCSPVFRLSFSDFSVVPLSPALLLPSFFRRAFSILAQPPPPPPPSRSPCPHQPAMPPYFTLLDFSATLLAPLRATSAPLSFSCPLPMSIFSPFLSFLLSVCFASIHETVPRVGVAG